MEQDDAFHLTAVDVRRYEFGTVMRGYDKARVDLFKAQVADEMERLMRANQELDDKARGFHEQLRAFRERDRALNEALVSAQQLRGEMKEQASREADLIVAEARAEAARVVEQARAEAARIGEAAREQQVALRLELEQLERARKAYLHHLRALAERHLGEVAAFEAQAAYGAPPARPSQPVPAPAASAAPAPAVEPAPAPAAEPASAPAVEPSADDSASEPAA